MMTVRLRKKPSILYQFLMMKALFFKTTIHHIINALFSSSKYYEKEALIADPCDGPILASLMGKIFLFVYVGALSIP